MPQPFGELVLPPSVRRATHFGYIHTPYIPLQVTGTTFQPSILRPFDPYRDYEQMRDYPDLTTPGTDDAERVWPTFIQLPPNPMTTDDPLEHEGVRYASDKTGKGSRLFLDVRRQEELRVEYDERLVAREKTYNEFATAVLKKPLKGDGRRLVRYGALSTCADLTGLLTGIYYAIPYQPTAMMAHVELMSLEGVTAKRVTLRCFRERVLAGEFELLTTLEAMAHAANG